MAQPYMKIWWGDFFRDTMHLDDAEMGSYTALLGAMWSNEARLPNDQKKLMRICRCPPDKWEERWRTLLPFLTFENGFVTQKRLKEEWDDAMRLSQVRSKAGKKGGRPKKRSGKRVKTNRKANQKLTGCGYGCGSDSASKDSESVVEGQDNAEA